MVLRIRKYKFNFTICGSASQITTRKGERRKKKLNKKKGPHNKIVRCLFGGCFHVIFSPPALLDIRSS